MEKTFERYIIRKDLLFKHAKGRMNIYGQEIHPYHEIFLFLGGNAEFLTEDLRTTLQPGTLILIPQGHFHQFNVKTEDEYERYVLNFSTLPHIDESQVMDRVKLLERPGPFLQGLFTRLAQAASGSCPEKDQHLLLTALTTVILIELKQSEAFVSIKNRSRDTLLSRTIQYIGSHFTQPLTVEQIAQELAVSISQLSHTFKKELGVSVYRYITEKRLAFASQLLQSGICPTEVALQCGFSDYSAFYRAFVKMFGKAPSGRKGKI